ncbi:MAG: YIP1 family protein [Candidatus Obscuribacterales bacterium]|nr:YIP1 family protein [Candidatus Obscuribacterales bacterium]
MDEVNPSEQIQSEDMSEKRSPHRSASMPASSAMPEFLSQYIEVSKRVLLSPNLFFSEMKLEGGLKEPAVYLAISAAGHALLSAVMKFKPLSIPSDFTFELVAGFLIAGVAYFLGTAMGAKSSYEATFKVIAYTSCVRILAALPGIGALVPLWSLVLHFLGLRKVLGLNPVQIVSIMVMSSLLMAVLQLAKFFHLF